LSANPAFQDVNDLEEKSSMHAYVRALRAPFLTGSLITVMVGAAYGLSEGRFSFPLLGITLLGVGALHLGANLLNDYYDARGSDPINKKLTPFSGGSRVIQNGEVPGFVVLLMATGFLCLGFAAGLWLVFLGRPWVIFFGALGLLSGWAYSASPLQLMARGLGELAIFFSFGPLITLGTYYVISGTVNWSAFAVGFPQGFLVAAIIWINEFPDLQADKEARKKNLVVRLGLKASRLGYCAIMLLAFLSVVFLVGVMNMSYLIMLGFVSFPLALKAMKISWQRHESHKGLIPAQAMTIQTVVAHGVLLSLGLVLSRYLGK
jgi:1,4-dihydroxy-2-naphthoate polyprenyltransferase